MLFSNFKCIHYIKNDLPKYNAFSRVFTFSHPISYIKELRNNLNFTKTN